MSTNKLSKTTTVSLGLAIAAIIGAILFFVLNRNGAYDGSVYKLTSPTPQAFEPESFKPKPQGFEPETFKPMPQGFEPETFKPKTQGFEPETFKPKQ